MGLLVRRGRKGGRWNDSHGPIVNEWKWQVRGALETGKMVTCTSFRHGTHQFVIYKRAAHVAHSSHHDLLFPHPTPPTPFIYHTICIDLISGASSSSTPSRSSRVESIGYRRSIFMHMTRLLCRTKNKTQSHQQKRTRRKKGKRERERHDACPASQPNLTPTTHSPHSHLFRP